MHLLVSDYEHIIRGGNGESQCYVLWNLSLGGRRSNENDNARRRRPFIDCENQAAMGPEDRRLRKHWKTEAHSSIPLKPVFQIHKSLNRGANEEYI